MLNLFKKGQKQKTQSISSKQQPNVYYHDEKPQLPNNFANLVLELQMQLEFVETYNMEVVQQLNELYRIAIEYYIHEDARKALYFQKKLATLLADPQTLKLIQKKQTQPKQNIANQSAYTSHLKIQLNKFTTQSNHVVKNLIEGCERRIQNNNRLFSQNIGSQEEQLQKRLQQRSKSKKKSSIIQSQDQ